jgi:hypothetical protein
MRSSVEYLVRYCEPPARVFLTAAMPDFHQKSLRQYAEGLGLPIPPEVAGHLGYDQLAYASEAGQRTVTRFRRSFVFQDPCPAFLFEELS